MHSMKSADDNRGTIMNCEKIREKERENESPAVQL
jgi:hypothetical protein